MENISRDLEREIANARPKLPKKPKKKEILILSQDGGLRSGWYLRFCNRLLMILTAIALSGCIVLYFMHNTIQTRNLQIIQELDHMGDTYQDLLHERETLMARLFLMQKDMAGTASKKKKSKPTPLPTSLKEELHKNTEANSTETARAFSNEKPEEKSVEPIQPVTPPTPAIVTVQKFSIEKAPEDESGTKKLMVKVTIRNVSKSDENISGRIFAAIKPRQGTDQDWLVSPKSSVKNGVPATPKKGLSFSIVRFRPVKFMFETEKAIDFFHEAAVFVFDKKGALITKCVFGIDQTDITEN